jgi:hypothetical protein
MKKLLTVFLLAISLSTFSQIKKPITEGNIIISGSGSLQSYRGETITGNTVSKRSVFALNLSPGAGYFIIDNFALGANITGSYYKQGLNKYYTLGIGPWARYYFDEGIFVKAETNFILFHGMGSNDSRQRTYSIAPGVGYAWFLNQKVSLEPCLSYIFSHTRYSSDFNEKLNNLQLEVRLSIFL